MDTLELVFEFTDNRSEKSQSEVKVVIDMLIIKSMLIVPHKFTNIDQIVLNILMKFIDNLKMMNIFDFLTLVFLNIKEQHKFHQQFLQFFIEFLTFLRIVPHTPTVEQHIVVSNDFSQNILDQLIIRIYHVVTTQFELNVQYLVYNL